MLETRVLPAYPSAALFERSLDLIFPPVCVGCRRVGRWICATCWKDVPWIHERDCFECGRPSPTVSCVRCSKKAPSLDRLIAVAEFEGTAREAVHHLKFHGHHAISTLLGKLMAEAAPKEFDVVAHVPLHQKRRRERGYDQSALLAKVIARHLHLPFESNVLTRTRRTEQQANLQTQDRRSNVRRAFQATSRSQSKAILLVDDVSTTGATMDAAAMALREAGVGSVTGLVFAH